MSDFVIPAGNAKGTPITQATDRDLRYWNDRIAKDLAEGSSRFPDRDRPLGEAIAAELARRAGGGAPAPAATPPKPAPAPSRALATSAPAAPSTLVVASRNSTQINAQLQEMRAAYHLVAPATVCGTLPEGCEVAFSLVQVNPDDCYPLSGGKMGLDGTSLKQIGAAAGVSWDDQACRRLDDGSDPHYCHFVAVGRVRNFDGSLRVLTGTVEIDARDGSPQIDEIVTKARNAKDRNGNPSPRDPAGQILELRKFLLRHAETKAKLRAIADMGIKRSYTRAELAKPFAVARLMWTGQSDDPELRRLFALKQADAMIGGIAGLYGQQNAPPYATQPQAAPALAPARPQPCLDPGCSAGQHPALHAPPPVCAVPRHDDAVTTDGEKLGSDPHSAEDY